MGCGSPVVKVSDNGRQVMSSSPVRLKTRRVGERCTLNLSRAQTFFRWCGVVVRYRSPVSGSVITQVAAPVAWPRIIGENNSTRPLNSKTKTIAAEKQLNSSGQKQLNSAAGMKQINSAGGCRRLQAVDGSAELSCFVPTDELSCFVPTDELSCFLLLNCFVPTDELSCFLLLS
ncbi:hypothetical protein TNCV_4563692 [Trichonephila clavipes]|uniref:Uncharacterized protein n=1 Tax=Trichonephila clavipes TaxID=2585209 RepID=A0A8X6W599_TRICX|nr:hypothetical protein TNCV_4563692 [Trichonephila clavipes]